MFNLLTQSLSSLFLALFALAAGSTSTTLQSCIVSLSVAGALYKGEGDLSDEIVHMLHVVLIYLVLPTLYHKKDINHRIGKAYFNVICDLDHSLIVLLTILGHVTGLK